MFKVDHRRNVERSNRRMKSHRSALLIVGIGSTESQVLLSVLRERGPCHVLLGGSDDHTQRNAT